MYNNYTNGHLPNCSEFKSKCANETLLRDPLTYIIIMYTECFIILSEKYNEYYCSIKHFYLFCFLYY